MVVLIMYIVLLRLHADAQFGSMSLCFLHHSNHYIIYYSSIMSLEKLSPIIIKLWQHNWDT